MQPAQMYGEIYRMIERSRDDIYELGDRIYCIPETGFREFKTSAMVAEAFSSLEAAEPRLSKKTFSDIPGLKYTFDTGRPGPGVAVLGELDAVLCAAHPDSDPVTGAVHACGHNIQTAAMYGAAIGLLLGGDTTRLCGKIHFIAVPAEELIEVPYRKQLMSEGKIMAPGGKAELVARGWFDDVDICLMVHVMAEDASGSRIMIRSSNGCMMKEVHFAGKAAHAGTSPHDGINALYAAHTALAAVNSIRETFREADCVRIHPIITKGGDAINVIPDNVRMETYIRAKSYDAMLNAARKFDRAMAGGAVSLGASVTIEDMHSAFPLINAPGLVSAAKEVLGGFAGDYKEIMTGHTAGSTDLGDLAAIMPVIQPYIASIRGGLHEPSYRIEDRELAYVVSAKFLAGMCQYLLENGASKAKETISGYKPLFSSKEGMIGNFNKMFLRKTLPFDVALPWSAGIFPE